MSFGMLLVCLLAGVSLSYSRQSPAIIPLDDGNYAIYPETLTARPPLESPYTAPDGAEYVLALTKDDTWAIIPVTVENSARNGRECDRDSTDFPFYARYGIHADIELAATRRITGRSVARITILGRPGGLSEDGFMAADEDIISVLRGDNALVKRLGLTHPGLARPLFHVWNMILTDRALGRWNMATHYWENMVAVAYHDGMVSLEAGDTRGGQYSIFDDGIEGAYFMTIQRNLSREEEAFLNERYARLSVSERDRFLELLTTIRTGEMEPYYIMRYGFYEGHTPWRTDPVAIAFVFGLKTIREIEAAFPGVLYETLTRHYTIESEGR